MKNTKKAISLINLILIVIVIIVIGTFILVLSADSLDVSGNKKTKFKTTIESYQSALESYKAKLYARESGTFDEKSLKADLNTLEYNGSLQRGNIYTVIPSLSGSKYKKKIKIVSGKIDISEFKGKYLEWAKEELGNLAYNPEEEESEKNKVEIETRELGEGTSLINRALNEKIPYVPDDFDYIEGTTIDEGYTIIDKFENEYVWIPVEDMTPFELESNTKMTGILVNNFNGIKESITKYGGFYIGKYEASLIDGKVSSKKNVIPLVNIKWGELTSKFGNGAYSYARNVATINSYKKLKSTLLYDSMWTSTLNFMGISNDNNSVKYGNYNGANFNIDNKEARGSKDEGETFEYIASKSTNSRVLFTTGASDRNCIKNIYDIAGNVSEWTISLLNNNEETAITRGGDYYDLSNLLSAKYASEKSVLEESSTIGFRVALYIE